MSYGVNETFHLKELLEILFRHKKSAGLVMLVTFLVVFVGVYLWPETYEAHSKILVKVGRENVSQLGFGQDSSKQFVTSGVRPEDLNTELEILHNWDLVGEVVEKLGIDFLLPKPEIPTSFFKKIKYYSKKGVGKLKDGLYEVLYLFDLKKRLSDKEKVEIALFRSIKPDSVPTSNVINVSFSWIDPEIAKETLQLLIKGYLDNHLAAHQVSKGYKFLKEQVGILQKRLTDNENKLNSLKKEKNVFDLGSQKDTLLKRISTLKTELQDTIIKMAELRRAIDTLKVQLEAEKEVTQTSSRQDRNPVIEMLNNRLADLKLKKGRLLKKFTDTSRPITSMNTEIKNIEDILGEEKRTVLGSVTVSTNNIFSEIKTNLGKLQVEQASLSKRKILLQNYINKQNTLLVELSGHELEIKRLKRQIGLDEKEYTNYNIKLEEARVTTVLDNEKFVNVRVIETAVASPIPASPRKLLLIGVGFAVSLLGGIAYAFLLEYFDRSFMFAEDAESYLKLPVLSTIREIEDERI